MQRLTGVLADSVDATAVEVHISNSLGDPLAKIPVAIAVQHSDDGAAVFISPETQATDSSGVATAYVSSDRIGTATVTAVVYPETSANTLSQTATIRFVAEVGDTIAPPTLSHVPVGAGPRSLATADLNFDGLTDVVVAEWGSNSIRVLLSEGGGEFSESSLHVLHASPKAVALVDLDGDGKRDIVTSLPFEQEIVALQGLGHGKFEAAPMAVIAGSEVHALATHAGSADDDGALWLSTSRPENLLSGKWQDTEQLSLETLAPGAGALPSALVSGDLNSDGIADLVTAFLGSHNVVVRFGTPEGMVAEDEQLQMRSPSAVAVSDLDGNGRDDIAVVSLENATLSWFLQSAQLPARWTRHTTAVCPQPQAVTIGDYNGDRYADLAVACAGAGHADGGAVNDQGVMLLLGAADETFTAAALIVTGGLPVTLVQGDFDGDGSTDLLTANYDSSSLTLMLSDTVMPAF